MAEDLQNMLDALGRKGITGRPGDVKPPPPPWLETAEPGAGNDGSADTAPVADLPLPDPSGGEQRDS